MAHCLGIDAGGTYTDAVIIDMASKKIVSCGSALTTYPDPIGGISDALDRLDPALLKSVKALSVSTTLATNTVLENTGDPAALILVGDCTVPKDADIPDLLVVRGGHTFEGDEAEELDIDAVRAFVSRVAAHVSAYAVSSFFSIRNPEHELRIKELIREMTGCPVVCGHELAQSPGAYERGVTAYLNAILLPVTDRFLRAVKKETERRGSNAEIRVLKCNGAVQNVEEAINRPVESVFSGPAASLLGAAHLSGRDTCVMIDVGGTSTDVSMIKDGIALTDDDGASVGRWKTSVSALKTETSAMGGDSLVWIWSPSVSETGNPEKINIGPKKVIPLCRAAADFPEIVADMKKRWFSDRHRFGPFIQPTIFYVRSGSDAESGSASCPGSGFASESASVSASDSVSGSDSADISLTPEASAVLKRIGDRPVSLPDIIWDMKFIPAEAVGELVRKKKIRVIGLTPTDILHAAHVFNEWDTEASEIAVSIISDLVGMTPVEFCDVVRRMFARNMVREIVYYLSGTLSREEIGRFLEADELPVLFKTNIPVVMIGGPVGAYAESIRRYIDAPAIVPPYAAVGNAVGALMGKVSKRVEITVRLTYNESKYGIRTKSVAVYTPTGRRLFPSIEKAAAFAKECGRALIYEYMRKVPVADEDVSFTVKKEDISVGGTVPVSSKYIFEGIAQIRYPE